jgi:hypothetical protein
MNNMNSKLPFIALVLAIAAYVMFSHPSLQPEFAKRKSVSASAIKKDFDEYSKKLKDAVAVEAKHKEELAELARRAAVDEATTKAARANAPATVFVPSNDVNAKTASMGAAPLGSHLVMPTVPATTEGTVASQVPTVRGEVGSGGGGGGDQESPTGEKLPAGVKSNVRPRKQITLDKATILKLIADAKEKGRQYADKDGKIPDIPAAPAKDIVKSAAQSLASAAGFSITPDAQSAAPSASAVASSTNNSVQVKAAAITAPVTSSKSPYENTVSAKQLAEFEDQERSYQGTPQAGQVKVGQNFGQKKPQAMPSTVVNKIGVATAPSQSAATSKSSAPTPTSEVVTTTIVSRTPTTRFLYFKIADSIVRFHVDPNFGDRELNTIIQALGTACVKTTDPDKLCDPERRNSLTVDKAFYADVQLSQVSDWSKMTTPVGQMWKLSCMSGGEECFALSTKVRTFKLTAKKAPFGLRVIAHGFESEAVSKKRVPASASGSKMKSIEKVYMTRTTTAVVPHLPKGTL